MKYPSGLLCDSPPGLSYIPPCGTHGFHGVPPSCPPVPTSAKRQAATAVCILSDKEEVGSMGNTGMESHVFDTFVAELLNKRGENRPNLLDKVFCNSRMLSADVDAGLDPIYASVSEKNNASFLGYGIGFNKYTGARGKSGASDANAEYVAEIRNMLESQGISYQIAELNREELSSNNKDSELGLISS